MTQYEQIIIILAKAVQNYIKQESISFEQKGLDNVVNPSIHCEETKGVSQ